MLLSTKMFAEVLGIAALIATYGIGAVPAIAADTPVSVTNTTANPVPTVITNSSANLINTKVWNTVAVKVGNTAAAPVISQITNTIANPVGVTVANKPAHIPFSKRFDIVISHGAGSATLTVPEGKKLVVKYVSADAGVVVGAHILFDFASYNQGAEVEAHMPMTDQGVILGQQVYCMSQQTLIFADANSTVTVAALDSDSSGSGGLIVGIYGYLVDASAASFE